MDAGHMRRYWNARARENAYFFVDNRLDYHSPDLERFWRQGEEDLDLLLGAVAVRLDPTDRVVEIGCGVGRLTRVIATRAASVRALDVSNEMLAIARRNLADLANVELLQGDGTTLSGVQEASADACISHVVFQHIPDPQVVLGYVAEMGRVLAPGGWAAFQISNDPAPHRPRRGRLLRAPLALAGRSPRGEADPAWLGSMVDLDELGTVVRRARMTVERVVNPGEQFCVVLTRRTDA